MKHLAEKIVIYQINQGIITNDEKENYIYAYFILMEQTINIFIAFSIGIITGNVIYVISFLISYIWLIQTVKVVAQQNAIMNVAEVVEITVDHPV